LTDDLGIGQQLERALPYFDYVMPMVYPSHYNKGFAGLANPNSDPYKVVYTSMIEAVRRTVSTESSVKTIDGETIFKTEIVPATINPETGETIATSTKQVPSGLYTKESYSKLKMRPWLQDFDYGKDYTPADIQGQIQATYDAGLTSWIFWDPGNKYSALRQVLKNDTTTQVSQ
jgi:ABC-type molybdate transport system substrate-binding protein